MHKPQRGVRRVQTQALIGGTCNCPCASPGIHAHWNAEVAWLNSRDEVLAVVRINRGRARGRVAQRLERIHHKVALAARHVADARARRDLGEDAAQLPPGRELDHLVCLAVRHEDVV